MPESLEGGASLPAGIVRVDVRLARRRLTVLGFVAGEGRVLTVQPLDDVDPTKTTFEVRFDADPTLYPARRLESGNALEGRWLLLECEQAHAARALPLTEDPSPGAECLGFKWVGDRVVAVSGRVGHVAFVDAGMPSAVFRPAAPEESAAPFAGAPCVVRGEVIGLLAGEFPAGREHLLDLIPSEAIARLSARLGPAGRLRVRRAPVGRPPQWPKRRPSMVGWYDPGPLMTTTANMFISKIFGEFDDYRSTESLFGPRHEHALAPTGHGREELWLDYVADTGDGFDPTYTIASAVSLAHLPVQGPDDRWYHTRRGHVLVFGGDQVYPTATAADYRQRLIRPFRLAATGEVDAHATLESMHPWGRLPAGVPETALPGFDPLEPYDPDRDFVGVDDGLAPVRRLPPRLPWITSIPGNHDWYDNLVQFMRIFCSGERFAEWNPVQSRSYFIKRLPWGWWVFGVDIQLHHDIDQNQLRYFLDWVDVMAPGDKVVLCTAEPHWIEAKEGEADDKRPYLTVLERALEKGDHLAVWLAGDLHHYRRHADAEGRQKITAGGGGAFLHATHPEKPVAVLPRRADGTTHRPLRPAEIGLEASFPTPLESRAYSLRALLFPLVNWRFAVCMGLLYLIGAWQLVPLIGASRTIPGTLGDLPASELGAIVGNLLETALVNPVAALYLLGVLMGIRALSNTPSRLYNWVAGTAHGTLHVLAIFYVYWLAARLTTFHMTMAPRSTEQMLVAGPLVLLVGGLIAGCLMGVYLLLSNALLGLHSNEAFSALRCPDWKHFLRIKVTPDSLTIFPIGFRRVPRRWIARAGSAGPVRWPARAELRRPRLIEAPIVVRRR